MRSDPAEFDLVAPGNLHAVVALLADEPGVWLPVAGGTDLMVLFAAGTLAARRLVSIWNLPELRQIEVFAHEIRVGAGCTYTDLREHVIVRQEFSLLARPPGCTRLPPNPNPPTPSGTPSTAP